MLLISDVHGATEKLRRAASSSDQLVILGDLINFIDYRTYDGILADLVGREWVAELVALRAEGDFDAARQRWASVREGSEDDLRMRSRELIEAAYAEVLSGLQGADAIVTFGNVDRVDVLVEHLPNGNQFVEVGTFEIDGWLVGIMGGGVKSGLNVPGELDEDSMAERLDQLGRVEVLCTHVPPAISPLATDVVGGTTKGSTAVLDYIREHQPEFHYFGDIHQPQAVEWSIGETRCRNVGYFRATGLGVRHASREGSSHS